MQRQTPRHLLYSLLPLLFIMIAIIVGTLNMKQIQNFLIGALGDEAAIQINVQVSEGQLERPWRNIAQGGESKDWRLTPLIPQMKAVNIEYIRLDHLYDFYDIVGKNGQTLTFDFTKLDLMLDDILAAGAKPYLSLSYTPPVLAPNGDITGMPNLTEWQLVVQKTIEHVSGTRQIADAYYEVWNEPDLFGQFKTYGSKNYVDLYRAAARGAQQAQVSQPYKFGGPAITALYKNWVDGLVQATTAENLHLDFFSWHRYSKDIEVFRSDIAKVTEWFMAYPQKESIELHITEWGHESAIDPGYDSNFGAIHTLAVSTELSGNIDKTFLFEIQDGIDPAGNARWGRWGVFDSQGKAKPRYQALQLLEKLGNERISLLGRGTWVKGIAARDKDSITVLIVNYDPTGRHSEVVPVTFTGLTPGTFELTKQFFLGATFTEKIATTSSELLTTLPMGANSATFIRLTPIVQQNAL